MVPQLEGPETEETNSGTPSPRHCPTTHTATGDDAPLKVKDHTPLETKGSRSNTWPQSGEVSETGGGSLRGDGLQGPQFEPGDPVSAFRRCQRLPCCGQLHFGWVAGSLVRHHATRAACNASERGGCVALARGLYTVASSCATVACLAELLPL